MYLGIDLGTSGVKLLLLDDAHAVVATADAAVPQHRPQPTWSEQHPADWWAAVESAVAQLRAQAPAAWAQVRGRAHITPDHRQPRHARLHRAQAALAAHT